MEFDISFKLFKAMIIECFCCCDFFSVFQFITLSFAYMHYMHRVYIIQIGNAYIYISYASVGIGQRGPSRSW